MSALLKKKDVFFSKAHREDIVQHGHVGRCVPTSMSHVQHHDLEVTVHSLDDDSKKVLYIPDIQKHSAVFA